MDNATSTATDVEHIGTASYDPADNKLRLRPYARLPRDLYDRVKAAGFAWAPKQEIFVAPAWTPERADLLAELCGEIGDEDTSLVDRAEVRADRFEEYRDKRAADSAQAHKAVAAIADNIPLGQPILVGHHSEKHARKDAERIENGMRKAIKMWETSEYWKQRAQGALAHAKYKELPAVRHRRIKGLEADQRKYQKGVAQAEGFVKLWQADGLTLDRAKVIANHDHVSKCFTLAEFPRDPPASQYEGAMSLWSALDGGVCTAEQAREIALRVHAREIARWNRWLAHFGFRLEYERAMLDEAGGTAADKFAIEVGGRVFVGGWRNAWCTVTKVNRANGAINSVSTLDAGVVSIEKVTDYQPPAEGVAEKVKAAKKLPPLVNYPGEGFRHMTKAEYESRSKHSDFYRACRVEASDKYGAHRRREAPREGGQYYNMVGVYLTDAPTKQPPAPDAAPAVDVSDLRRVREPSHHRAPRPESSPEAAAVNALRETLKAGVQVVAVAELYETSPDLAREVVARADVAGKTVLEPSAGMGRLAMEAVRQGASRVVCIENAPACAQALRARKMFSAVHQVDFLDVYGTPDGGLDPAARGVSGIVGADSFERIVMNPPFANGADVRHVLHAWHHWLAPGGRLVAVMAAGVRFRADRANFRALVDEHGTMEDLPEGSFKASGTDVSTVVVTLTK